MKNICYCNHFLTDIEVSNRYGISRPTVWRWAKAGTFPKPKKLNGSARWKLEEIQQWEDNLKDYDEEIDQLIEKIEKEEKNVEKKRK